MPLYEYTYSKNLMRQRFELAKIWEYRCTLSVTCVNNSPKLSWGQSKAVCITVSGVSIDKICAKSRHRILGSCCRVSWKSCSRAFLDSPGIVVDFLSASIIASRNSLEDFMFSIVRSNSSTSSRFLHLPIYPIVEGIMSESIVRQTRIPNR